MQPRRISIILSALWLAAATAQAADIAFDVHNIRFKKVFEANEQILSAIQDRDGFFWFATLNSGLLKFDGMSIKYYKKGKNSISSDGLAFLYETKDGMIWIGTFGDGLNVYDKQKNAFTYYRNNPNDPTTLSGNTIPVHSGQPIFEDSRGAVWVGTTTGLNKFDRATKTFTRYLPKPDDPHSLSQESVKAIVEDHDGTLWIGTESGGVNKLDSASGTFTRYRSQPDNPNSLSSDNITAMLVGKDGILWIGTQQGALNRFDPKTEQVTRYLPDPKNPNSMGSGQVESILEDERGLLWISHTHGDTGLTMFDKQHTFIKYKADANNPYALASSDITKVYQDPQTKTIWLFGWKGPISVYDPELQKFTLYQGRPDNPNGLLSNNAAQFAQDREQDDVFWLSSTETGLYRYDKAHGTWQNFQPNPNDPSAILAKFPTALFDDGTGTLWLAYANGGMSKFDKQTGKCVKHYKHDPNDPTSMAEAHEVGAIVADKHDPNILWIATKALTKFDKRAEKFTNFPLAGVQWYLNIYEDADGILWLPTLGQGLMKFDKKSETIASIYTHNADDPSSVGSNVLTDALETSNGAFWISSAENGLSKFDKQTGKFKNYLPADGFPMAAVYALVEDNDGNLWMAGASGLVRLNLQTEEITLFTADDGLQGNLFFQGKLKARDGEMWFGGISGANSFYPQNLTKNPFKPPVYLTALKQGNEEMALPSAPERAQAIQLDWRNNFFEFEFAALNYTSPEKNRYQYKLEGVDKDWYDAGARRFGRYAGLPDGTHTLRVRGSNNDGIWGDREATLQVVVMPPYWRTWWFYALCTLAGAGVIGFVYRTQVKIQTEAALHHAADREKEAAEREKIAAQREREAANAANTAKSEFLSNMSHELRTPLNGILGYAQILIRDKTLTAVQKDGLNIIQQSGSHLLTLINDILDLAKVEAGRLDLVPGNVHFRSFLDGIAGIIRMRAEQKNLLFELQTPTPLPDGVVADEKRLRQVLLNLLGNAVKFTKAGKVLLRVSALRSRQQEAQHVDLIRFEVIDTGVGMTPESVGKLFKPFEQVGDAQSRAEGTGLGLAISRRLVQLMGGDIEIKSELGHGTTFWFEIELPGAAVELREVQQRREQEVTGYAGPRRKILVADDKLSNRLVMVHLLEPLGFEIELAEDGQQLVDKAQAFRPDAILTDLIMPNLTGFEAAQQIRQMPDARNTVIIAVSASVFEMDKEKSKIAGCDDFLSKPVVASQLFDMLGTHLRLEWTYAEREAAPESPSAEETPTAEIALPTSAEVARLREAALGGVPDEILAEAARLEQRNPAYAPFARRIAAFVRQYQDEELLAFLEQAQVK